MLLVRDDSLSDNVFVIKWLMKKTGVKWVESCFGKFKEFVKRNKTVGIRNVLKTTYNIILYVCAEINSFTMKKGETFDIDWKPFKSMSSVETVCMNFYKKETEDADNTFL